MACAETVDVSYVEGNVMIRQGSAWAPVSAGDTVGSGASLRLGEAASVELHAQGQKIVLSRAGTYSLGRILSARKAMDAAGVGSSLQAALVHLVRGPSLRQSAAMGVLGSRSPSDDEREARAARSAARRSQAEMDGARQGEVEGSRRADEGPPVAAEAAPAAEAPTADELPSAAEAPTPAQVAPAVPQDSPSSLDEGKALIATQQYDRPLTSSRRRWKAPPSSSRAKCAITSRTPAP